MGLGNRKQSCELADYEAESALSAGYAVGFGTSADQAEVISSTDTRILGVNRYARAEGERAEIVVFGPTDAVAGAAIAFGDFLEADATGKLIPIATPSVGHCVGQAFSAAAADGDLVVVFVGMGR